MTIALVVSGVLFSAFSHARDLADIKEEGVLRHIGVPYANFISYINNGSIHSLSGLDVEIVKGFADHLGVRYEFIPASWTNVIGKLTGQQTEFTDNKIVKGGSVAQEGILSPMALPYCRGAHSLSLSLMITSRQPCGSWREQIQIYNPSNQVAQQHKIFLPSNRS
ncbi:extracellular solute binding protein ScrB [Photobacterium aphoticum]|uniref:Extracellular solute binding protein ScrB n=1 Tax=Photobacterium aphoticum TaxID=754436 RepID=A0A090QKP4_9GAMM|nr:extracellular solute binding protein ScrB [Photobacterium aphoticum]